MTRALEISGLSKTYDSGVQALKGIDLQVEKGDFFALLGPNGAGKSTTIGIITSLVNKSGGTVKIFDHDIDKELADLAQLKEESESATRAATEELKETNLTYDSVQKVAEDAQVEL